MELLRGVHGVSAREVVLVDIGLLAIASLPLRCLLRTGEGSGARMDMEDEPV